MAIVRGSLKDYANATLHGLQPVVEFHASQPGVRGIVMHTTRTPTVEPTVSGSFEIDLQPTETVRGNVFYTVVVRWMDRAGHFVDQDTFLDKLYVPAQGGDIGDLVTVPANPALVWYSDTAPPNPTPGTIWIYTGETTGSKRKGDMERWV